MAALCLAMAPGGLSIPGLDWADKEGGDSMTTPARTNQSRQPLVSLVMATHNRCAVVAETLLAIRACKLSRGEYEIIAVDNASTDETREELAGNVDEVVALPQNCGSCAKAYGVTRARGQYIVFLDDDSCPRVDSLSRMIERFEEDAELGAAGFTVHLPDGGQESGALPGVFVGCGVGFRASALREVGGLDSSFFMQAEEYDLCFRLAGAGWKVGVFDDLHVDHRKTATARRPARTTYFDIRNNLRVLARYAPREHYAALREDCIERYGWLAASLGHEESFSRGLGAGKRWAILERLSYRKKRVSADVFERFYRWGEIERRMSHLSTRGVKRIVLADFGKNILGFWRAAKRCGIAIEAVGDNRFAGVDRSDRMYRGIPVMQLGEALSRDVDAVIVSNSSRVHARIAAKRVAEITENPVFSWFGGGGGQDPVGLNFGTPCAVADNTSGMPLEVTRA
jgi:GT2 family glycosyltransferase